MAVAAYRKGCVGHRGRLSRIAGCRSEAMGGEPGVIQGGLS
jgi:hypothetical protein